MVKLGYITCYPTSREPIKLREKCYFFAIIYCNNAGYPEWWNDVEFKKDHICQKSN